MVQGTLSEDLRSVKTEKALFSAVFSLLKKMNFKKITVKGICEKAFISRAAFYAHFVDKYDLLSGWLGNLWTDNFWKNNYEDIEYILSRNLSDVTRVIKNILSDADGEVHQLLFKSILSTGMPALKNNSDTNQAKSVVLSNFFAGGIISYLTWQVNKDFPKHVPILNREVYNMINEFIKTQNSF